MAGPPFPRRCYPASTNTITIISLLTAISCYHLCPHLYHRHRHPRNHLYLHLPLVIIITTMSSSTTSRHSHHHQSTSTNITPTLPPGTLSSFFYEVAGHELCPKGSPSPNILSAGVRTYCSTSQTSSKEPMKPSIRAFAGWPTCLLLTSYFFFPS